jgi:hypothetical protein
VTRSVEDEICIGVHPDWRNVVKYQDHELIQALFGDFRERAELDPDGLLKQLSSLAVGHLVTYDAGLALADRPELRVLFESFQRI